MSALVALSSRKSFQPELLADLIQTMGHRASADANLFAHPFGGICMRPNSEEESAEVVDIYQGCLIAFDGYLVNESDLGQPEQTLCQKVVEAYLNLGPDFVEYLEGHYALAIYHVETEKLIIARDSFGVRPLYFAPTELGTVVASEAGAILRSGLVESTLNLSAMPEFWNQGYVTGAQTLFEGVYRLLPGQVKVFRHGEELYSKEHDLQKKIQSPTTYEPTTEHFEFALDSGLSAIKDDKIFMSLSGQIEESLTAIIVKSHQKDLKTASISFGDFASADMRLRAVQTQQFLQTDHLEQHFSDYDFWMQIPGTSAILDDLVVDERMLFKLKTIEAAPDDFVSAIDTAGAEVLFADRYLYSANPMTLLFKRNQQQKRGYTAGFAELFKNDSIPNWRKSDAKKVFKQKLKDQQWQDLTQALPASDLILLDRLYTAYRWQPHMPFLTKSMLQYFNALEESDKIKDKQGRQILRKALHEKAPTIDSTRSLQPMIMPIEAWLNDRRQFIAQYLTSHAGMRQVFVIKELKNLFKRELNAEAARLVFMMLMFACWYDVYITGQLPTENLFPEFHNLAQQVAQQEALEQED